MIEKTSIIISHRISSVKLSKKIIVIENGKVIEKGDHASLLRDKGNYYKLYQQQIESENS